MAPAPRLLVCRALRLPGLQTCSQVQLDLSPPAPPLPGPAPSWPSHLRQGGALGRRFQTWWRPHSAPGTEWPPCRSPCDSGGSVVPSFHRCVSVAARTVDPRLPRALLTHGPLPVSLTCFCAPATQPVPLTLGFGASSPGYQHQGRLLVPCHQRMPATGPSQHLLSLPECQCPIFTYLTS